MEKTPLHSLIASGTKLWLDSIDPELVDSNRTLGATGATSNPIIIGDILKSGRYDEQIRQLIDEGHDDETVAWHMTDRLVKSAQEVFHPVWVATAGNDGYVSFELDPLIDDPATGLSESQRIERYVELGKKWSAGQDNRMIKVPATPAGIGALEALAAAGVRLNVTLIFGMSQYEAARDAVWRGAQQLPSLDKFKSAFSVFVSRVDAYTKSQVPELSESAQGLVGIVNAKRIWRANQEFWKAKSTPLQQEIIFASTGTKDPSEAPWKYVEAFAGSDIETNPPQTNEATQQSGQVFVPNVGNMPPSEICAEIDRVVDFDNMEASLLEQGIQKFSEPHRKLLAVISEKRSELTAK